MRHDESITRLIHVNGPPGAGKSTLAEEWARLNPPAQCIDIDALRTQFDNWQSLPDTRLLAREEAVSQIEAHLANGCEVIVPQFLGRPEFIERLESVAAGCCVEFVEVMLEIDAANAIERFVSRRASLGPGDHPQADVDDADVAATIESAIEALRWVHATRSGIRRVESGSDADRTLARFMNALDGPLGAAQVDGGSSCDP